jgi:translation initiation factor 2-alpha kinase 4
MTDREIQVLSIVNHKHVVRYFNCWIEDPIQQVEPETIQDSESSSSTPGAVDEIFDLGVPSDPFAKAKSRSYPIVSFGIGSSRGGTNLASRHDDSEEETDDDDGHQTTEDSGDETESELPIAKPNQNRNGVVLSSVPSSALTDASRADPTSYRTLYIAMEFVDNVSPSLGPSSEVWS